MHQAQGIFKVRLAGNLAGEVPAHDKVVDVFKQMLDAGIGLVKIGNDLDAGSPRPPCSECSGGGVVAVDMKSAGIGDPFGVEVAGLQDEALIASAKHCALTGCVDEDERLWAAALGDCDQLRFDACAGEFPAMESRSVIISEFTDVPGAQAPMLAGDDGSSYLSAGEHFCRAVLDFGAGLRKGGKRDKCVGGVESHSDKIYLRRFGHSKIRSISLQLVNGQAHLEAGGARFRLDGNKAAMAANDALCSVESESKPEPGSLCREERLEDAVFHP
jgi:hypothetical protein